MGAASDKARNPIKPKVKGDLMNAYTEIKIDLTELRKPTEEQNNTIKQ